MKMTGCLPPLSHSLLLVRSKLPEGWSVQTVPHSARLYYLSHSSQTSYWIPPNESWTCPFGLPYGWEIAVDTTGKPYYINHVEQLTTYCDPRTDLVFELPEPREVAIARHNQLGFGFVAGSEKPVIVRFVTEGGPSVDKLLPGDEIWAVNGEDVREAPKDKVVNLVRCCSDRVSLLVCQPRNNDSSLKSALLSAAKRVRLKTNPSRVRFAEGVLVGTPPDSPAGKQSCVPLMPNVLRVFLENGQTKSFKYDLDTTVQDVLESVKDKLGLLRLCHFSLALEHPQGPRSHKLSLLRPEEKICKIASRPGSQHFRCLLRVVFVPIDPAELCRQDPVAFDYFYTQCVNDVVHGRFAYEMRYEACLRLGALHIQQVSIDCHSVQPGKISLKVMEKEYGLTKFLPAVLLENVKRKEVRKHLRYYMKRDATKHANSANAISNNNSGIITSPQINSTSSFSTSEAIRIKYVHMLGHLPSFGGRTFYVSFSETNTDMLLQVSPRTGITVRTAGRNIEPTLSIFYNMISSLKVSGETDVLKKLTVTLTGEHPQILDFLIDKDDIFDLVLFIQGYYRLFTQDILKVLWETDFKQPPVPPYYGLHSVKPAGWNYANDSRTDVETQCGQKEFLVDFSRGPPKYNCKSATKDAHLASMETDDSEEVVEQEETEEIRSNDKVSADVHTPLSVAQRNRDRFERLSAAAHKENEFDHLIEVALVGGRRRSSSSGADEFVRKTFLRAKDSLMIRAGNADSREVITRARSRESRDSFSANDLSSISGSDTESLSTPSESPIHRPQKSRPLSLSLLKNASFGLQSPDTLPCSLLSEAELHQITSTLGLDGSQLEDLLLLFPDNFCFDNEIIDLTLIQPPITPSDNGDDQQLATFSANIQPPTPFQDDQQADFADVMKRLGHGDTNVISESHTKVSQAIRKETRRQYDITVSPYGSPRKRASGGAEDYNKQFPSVHNKAEFEDFLKKCIIPPPPPTATKDEKSQKLMEFIEAKLRETARTSVEMSSSESRPQYRFSRPRRRSVAESESIKEEEEPPAGKIVNLVNNRAGKTIFRTVPMSSSKTYPLTLTAAADPQKALVAVSSHTHMAPQPTTADSPQSDADNVVLRQTFAAQSVTTCSTSTTSATKRQEYVYDEIFRKDSKMNSSAEVTEVDLRRFTGLEETEHEAPQITQVQLKHFVGLENLEGLNKGIASVELKNVQMSRTSTEVTAKRRIMTRIRSVDAHLASPESSPRKGKLSSPLRLFSGRSSPRQILEEEPVAPVTKMSLANYTGLEAGSSSIGVGEKTSPTVKPSQNGRSQGQIGSPLGNGFASVNGTSANIQTSASSLEMYQIAGDTIAALVVKVKDLVDRLPPRSPKKEAKQRDLYKTTLLVEAQLFAASSKAFVRVVTELKSDQIASQLDECCRRAESFFQAAASVLSCNESLFSAQILGAKTREVLLAFRLTIEAAGCARGHGLSDPNVKKLIRQSTTLAATLTALIRTVRET